MSDKNLLLDLVNYLITYASDIVTEDGIDIFRDWLPDSPTNAVALMEYPGTSSQVCNADERSISVQVRNESYETARKNIWTIYNLLYDPENDIRIIDDISATRWVIINARQAPFSLPKTDDGRFIFIFNMGVISSRDE
jgi:hypothetical protein